MGLTGLVTHKVLNSVRHIITDVHTIVRGEGDSPTSKELKFMRRVMNCKGRRVGGFTDRVTKRYII